MQIIKDVLFNKIKEIAPDYMISTYHPGKIKDNNSILLIETENLDERISYQIHVYNKERSDIEMIKEISELMRDLGFYRSKAGEISDPDYRHYMLSFTIMVGFSDNIF